MKGLHATIVSWIVGFLFLLGTGCSTPSETRDAEFSTTSDGVAHVQDVSVSGASGSYTFTVTVRSPDTGCERYADWWEVVTPSGALVYRRTLLRSHVQQNPFERSGGPVEIGANQTVIVRAHMNDTGYGGQAMRGSVASGFEPVDLDSDFASDLAEASPLPSGCAS